jgi:hypothetical protein
MDKVSQPYATRPIGAEDGTITEATMARTITSVRAGTR